MSPGKQRIIFTVSSPGIAGLFISEFEAENGCFIYSDDEREAKREKARESWLILLMHTSAFTVSLHFLTSGPPARKYRIGLVFVQQCWNIHRWQHAASTGSRWI